MELLLTDTRMLFELKKLLIIFLTMLQLVLPLVHAHAGRECQALANIGSGTLHIPGLEAYAAVQDALSFEARRPHYAAEGIVIAVDTGVKRNQNLFAADTEHYLLSSQVMVSQPSISKFDKSFSPPVPAFSCRRFASHSPRAPPIIAQ